MSRNNIIPAVLTIAGSDSGGGAGIQADLRTFHACNVYGCSAITALTAQNPHEVRQVTVPSPESVKQQLETVLDVMPIRYAKSGMLVNQEIIKCVAQTVSQRGLSLVVDPVMISTSGTYLLDQSAVSVMQEQLFPLAQWLTPNIPEAEFICKRKISCMSDLADAASAIYEKYQCNVILKSGHISNLDHATDIVCFEGKLFTLSSPVLALAGNTAHGTGCTLSAALTANLALGKSWQQAVVRAKAFVYGSLVEKVFLSDKLCQMYPPEKSYIKRISLNGY